MTQLADEVSQTLRDIPDFPQPGILFKDITPVLANPELFGRICDWMAADWGPVDRIVAMESRGFLFAGPLSERLKAGIAPARKRGKLPFETIEASYDLEYGSAHLQLHVDAVQPGERVLIVDDLIATGGTAAATVDLVRRLGGVVVGLVFLVELSFLPGRARLDAPVRSLVLL